MTNEELCKAIQDGQKDLIPQLWDQAYLFICSMAKKRLIGEEKHIKQLEDDLINESYFDFLKAIDGFKLDCGANFLTYLEYHIRNSFNRALGVRTSRDRRDPWRNAMSLEAPIEGTEDLTLQDMIIDHLAEEDYRFIENMDFWKDVHELLERAIYSVTKGQGQDILLIMLHKNYTPGEAISYLRIPENQRESARVAYYASLNRVRRYITGKARKECRRIGIYDYVEYRNVGPSAWKRHGFTSATELEAIRRVDRGMWDRIFTQVPAKDESNK